MGEGGTGMSHELDGAIAEKATQVKSQNVDKLPKDAKDIIQAVFDHSMPVSHGFPPDAIEVKLDDPVFNLLHGEGTVHFHALGNTEHYLHHRGNNEWAIIDCHDKVGDAARGREILEQEAKK
jgi:hypothetical protein